MLPTHSQNECTLICILLCFVHAFRATPNLQLTVCSLSHLKSVYLAKSVDHSIIQDRMSITLGFWDLLAGG